MNAMPMMTNPMMPPMLNGMGSMPMQMPMMPMMMGGMMPMMPMQMPMMMNGMNGMNGMMMPMLMGGMTPMMCKVSCEMTKDGMTMKMTPTDASMMPRMQERCDAINSMMAMGMPMTMMMGTMPMMASLPGTK